MHVFFYKAVLGVNFEMISLTSSTTSVSASIFVSKSFLDNISDFSRSDSIVNV